MVALIQLPFHGFYETSYSVMIDDAVTDFFRYDNSNSNIPDQAYWLIDYSQIRQAIARRYVENFAQHFEGETGIALNAEFESMTSPREYNFETDRIFAHIPESTIAALFAASEADGHTQLATLIKEECTSRSGFHSFYSNDFGEWLAKPVNSWDHNELQILLQAVLNIHAPDMDLSAWVIMPDEPGSGHLENWLCEAMPQVLIDFADLQREHEKQLDYDVFAETGIAYELGSDEPMPPLRCKFTRELFV